MNGSNLCNSWRLQTNSSTDWILSYMQSVRFLNEKWKSYFNFPKCAYWLVSWDAGWFPFWHYLSLLRISDKSLTINDITCITFILLVHISFVTNTSKWNKDGMERISLKGSWNQRKTKRKEQLFKQLLSLLLIKSNASEWVGFKWKGMGSGRGKGGRQEGRNHWFIKGWNIFKNKNPKCFRLTFSLFWDFWTDRKMKIQSWAEKLRQLRH